MEISSTVQFKFDHYPSNIKPKMLYLRKAILDTAKNLNISAIEETLKWGEPSYLAPEGSTIRMDWKTNHPEQYALYFKCTSKLVPTFKIVFGDLFDYEKNRAIVFDLKAEIPLKELQLCIGAALQYHLVKKLDLLGLDI